MKTVVILLGLLSVVLWPEPLLAQAPEPSVTDMSVMYLPVIAATTTPIDHEPPQSYELGRISTPEEPAAYLVAAGRPLHEIRSAVERFKLLRSGERPVTPANASMYALDCGYGQSATMIFFTGTGAWTGTWYTNYGAFPISRYCQGVCVHDRTLTLPYGRQRIYSHGLSGTSVAHLLGWRFG